MKPQDLQTMLNAFPKRYEDDVTRAARLFTSKDKMNLSGDYTHVTLTHEELKIPCRIYYNEVREGALTDLQSRLIACYQLCHHNGFVRQRCLRGLLESGHLYEHELPYIVYLTGSYLIEILDDIYERFDLLIESGLDRFILDNPRYLMTIEGRIGSYWGEYYQQIPKREYSGFAIQSYYQSVKRNKQPRWSPR